MGVENWMKLHLPKEMVQSLRRSNWEGKPIETLENFEEYIENSSLDEEECKTIEEYINETFDEHEASIFRKALAAANRKVKVMYKENGTTKYGWISKRKNSGALITRLYGKSTPKIVVSGVETQPYDGDFARPERCEGTMLIDVMNFIESNTKNTTVKYTNADGKKCERVESHKCKPTMSFYQNLAKSEISTLIGTKKPRFNIEWDISFQRKNLPSLFNAFLTQSLSTMPALKTLALRMQMSSGTKLTLISNLSTPRSAPNITNTHKRSRANETKTSSKTNEPNTGLRTLRCKIL